MTVPSEPIDQPAPAVFGATAHGYIVVGAEADSPPPLPISCPQRTSLASYWEHRRRLCWGGLRSCRGLFRKASNAHVSDGARDSKQRGSWTDRSTSRRTLGLCCCAATPRRHTNEFHQQAAASRKQSVWGAHREGPEPAADVNQGDHAAPARRDVMPNALGVAVAAVRDDISRGARAASV